MAIAFDAATDGGNNSGISSSHSFAHTCTGSDGLLLVGLMGDTTTDVITGATYNGVAMSLVTKVAAAGITSRWCYLFYLVGPAAGAHTVIISASNTTFILAGAMSYTGVNATGQPDSFNTATEPSDSGTITATTTVVDDTCWTMMVGGGFDDPGTSPTAGASTTRRTFDGAFGTWGMFDSNGIVGTGSQSLTLNYPGLSAGLNAVIASFSEATGVGVTVVLLGQGVM